MAKLHDMRLKLLIQQEHERISKSQPNDLDLSIVQARCLCWLALLAEAHEDQANDAEKRGDAEQAMGWFADSMRLRDVINLVTTIEIPYASETETSFIDENVGNSYENNEVESYTETTLSPNNHFTNFNPPTSLKETSEKDTVTEGNIDRFKNIAQSLEKHCEKISNLIKIHNQKLEEQAEVDKKLFEKINLIKNKNKDDNAVEVIEDSLLWARKKFDMLKKKTS
jgi:hypothetical protein